MKASESTRFFSFSDRACSFLIISRRSGLGFYSKLVQIKSQLSLGQELREFIIQMKDNFISTAQNLK